jgi:hypothetical protein
VTDGKKMEGSFSTGQSPQWAVVPVEEEEEEMYLTVYNNNNNNNNAHIIRKVLG